MVPKRSAGVVDLSSSDDSENDDLDDVQCSQLIWIMIHINLLRKLRLFQM